MMDAALFIAALGCGLIAGFFYAFSVCVMRALAMQPPAYGIAVMQSINVVVINPWFLTPFVGLTALAAVLAIVGLVRWGEPGAAWIVAGGLSYAIGSFGVTMRLNVPRNNALARVRADSDEGARLFVDFLDVWTKLNHLRAVASLVAAAAFTAALAL